MDRTHVYHLKVTCKASTATYIEVGGLRLIDVMFRMQTTSWRLRRHHARGQDFSLEGHKWSFNQVWIRLGHSPIKHLFRQRVFLHLSYLKVYLSKCWHRISKPLASCLIVLVGHSMFDSRAVWPPVASEGLRAVLSSDPGFCTRCLPRTKCGQVWGRFVFGQKLSFRSPRCFLPSRPFSF